jgi:hypothetical protein
MIFSFDVSGCSLAASGHDAGKHTVPDEVYNELPGLLSLPVDAD